MDTRLVLTLAFALLANLPLSGMALALEIMYLRVPPTEDPCTDPVQAGGYAVVPEQLRNQEGAAATIAGSGCGADTHCGRLIGSLRAAARTGAAREILIRASVEHHFVATGDFPADETHARALADLAVTGRASYGSLQEIGSDKEALADSLVADVRGRINDRLPAGHPGRDPADVVLLPSIEQALDRAYEVAWSIRGPSQYRQANRPGLGWVAVSGEDDSPHRPVNVPSAPYPQYDLTLAVPKGGQPPTLEVTTRYVVISDSADDSYPVDLGTLPVDQQPAPIDTDVVLYIHGHGSSAEEALSLADELLEQGEARQRPLAILAADLPSYAYSSRIRPGDLPASNRRYYPGLDLIEAFILEFVAALNEQLPGLEDRIVAVVGGSLGGNMTLRLGRRDSVAYPWLRNVVSWSPASSWAPFWDRSCTFFPVAKVKACMAVWALEGHPSAAWITGPGLMNQRERPDRSRREFFSHRLPFPLQEGVGVYDTATRWYRDNWPCKNSSLGASALFMKEIYHKFYRRWHWRIAYEQMMFSHTSPISAVSDDPLYTAITSRLLLLAGESDDTKPEHLYSSTEQMAEGMGAVDGTALFVADTGHSIHAERPRLLAGRILAFLYPPTVTTNPASDITGTGARLNATVNPNGAPVTLQFDYGPTPAFGGVTTLAIGASTVPLEVDRPVSGLECGSAYHFQARLSSQAGELTGLTRSFTTSPCSPPTVTTNPASDIGQNSARLNATVDPNGLPTTLVFDYGPTPAFGSQTILSVGAGTATVAVGRAVGGLECGSAYHFRARVSSQAGEDTGLTRSFTTSPCG